MHRHTGIVTDNIINLRNFYCSVFGFIVVYSKTEREYLSDLTSVKSASAQIIKLSKNGQTVIELLKFAKNKRRKSVELNTKGITHLALTVKNVNNVIGECVINGGKLVGKVITTEQVIVAFIQDPDGNKIEIVQEL